MKAPIALMLSFALLAGIAPVFGTYEVKQFVPRDEKPGDQFGYYIASFEDLFIVTAIGANNNTGLAYAYKCTDAHHCELTDVLAAPNGKPGDQFGVSCSVYDGLVVIGAQMGGEGFRGEAYLFSCRNPDRRCHFQSTLSNPQGPQAGGYYGYSSAIYKKTVYVASPGRDENTGIVYVFNCANPRHCTFTTTVTPNDRSPDSTFGISSAIDKGLAIFGSSYQNDFTGAAYAFKCSQAGHCHQIAKFEPGAGFGGSWFGLFLDVAGEKVYIGAPFLNNGYTFVYTCPKLQSCKQEDILTLGISLESANFGCFVSAYQDLVVITAQLRAGPGAAYVYDCSIPSQCARIDFLIPSNGENGDYFGYAADLNKELIMVSAAYHKNQTGRVYTYKTPTTTATSEVAHYVPPGAEAGDGFGYFVATQNDLVVVGAVGTNRGTGAVYVYKCRDASHCVLLDTLSPPAGSNLTLFGQSVSVYDGLVAVGVPNYNGPNYERHKGAVYLYDCKSPCRRCIFKALLTASDGKPSDGFGFYSAIYKNWLYVGAPGRHNFTGAVYVYNCENPAHCVFTSLITPSNANTVCINNVFCLFGSSVSVDDELLVIGAAGNFARVIHEGEAYVYRCVHGHCVETARFTPPQSVTPNLEESYYAGFLAVSGTTFIVGDPYTRGFRGAASVYSCPTPYTCHLASILIPANLDYSDNFGSFIAAYGDIFVVTAQGEEGLGYGDAYVYNCKNPEKCVEVDYLYASDGEIGANFGWSAGVTKEFIVVSAPFQNGTGEIYTYENPFSCENNDGNNRCHQNRRHHCNDSHHCNRNHPNNRNHHHRSKHCADMNWYQHCSQHA
jgi:transposase-like protein